MGLEADLSQLGTLAKSLDKAQATLLRKAIRNSVSEVGSAATKRAQEEARTFSSKIPPNIGLKTSFAARSASVVIATNLKRVPWARLYERGGKKSGGGYWKHPVFGSEKGGKSNDPVIRKQTATRWKNVQKWPKENTHPFFYKSVWAEKDELKNKIATEVAMILADLKSR